MKSVLVVEDNRDVRQSCARWLEAAGYEVNQAADSAQALRAADEHVPDLVLLDVSLPGMDGYALASLWKGNSQMAAVPIIVLSAKDGDEHLRLTRDAGAVLALRKPCPPELMLAAVKGALRL